MSAHFPLDELIASETATRFGIDNTPTPEHRANLEDILAPGLERIRALLGGHPIRVTSGYRSRALNEHPALNPHGPGAKDSRHLRGLAADITCPQFGSPLAVCRAIAESDIVTDQVIHEFGAWAHVAFAAEGEVPRAMRLTIASRATGYRTGLHEV